MRLIDADALREHHCDGCSEDVKASCKDDPVCATLMWVDEAPTIDAVPVVRCGECEYRRFSEFAGTGNIYCNLKHTYFPLDDFCKFGERRV